MSKKIFYRQCRFEQAYPANGKGKRYDVSWLPEAQAKVGNTIYFGERREDVDSEDLYTVTMVGDNRRSAEWLHEKRSDDKKQREASDV